MKSFKRTLFIMPVLFCGGSEKQIRFLIEGLYKKGYPISVLVESSLKEMEKDIQNLTDKYIKEVETATAKKESELTSV